MSNKNLFCLLFLFVLFAYSIPVFAWPVPDTGQTKCYDDEGSEIVCPNPGEPFYGQDGNYSINPMSYTKLDASGNELPDSASSWTMVRDNVTGLIWEVKTEANKDDEYTWDEVFDYVQSLNDSNFGGYSDWRVPTPKELKSIVDSGVYHPTINADYFPNIWSSGYWSSNSYASSTDSAWYVFFKNGGVFRISKSYTYYVRAVRSGQFWSFDDLVINNDGTVLDNNTGLMWQQATSDHEMTWKDALAYCENLNFAGYNDWRLPTDKELMSIVDYSTYDPAVYISVFSDIHLTGYWSSTPYEGETIMYYARAVDFSDGRVYSDAKSLPYYVRAVRLGQSGPFDNLVILFAASEASGTAPFQVSLTTTVSSGNPPYTFSYDFGDGTAGSNAQNVVHTYTTSGTYTPTVTVTDSQGQTATQSVIITVSEPAYENQPPTASITTNTSTGTSPLTVQFTGLGTDPEGQVLVYSWDFGDSQTAQGMTSSHTYTNPGTYTATLKVKDPEGLSGTASVIITVSEAVITEPVVSDENSIGKAIIIAGGGAHDQNTLYESSNELCQRFYRLLKKRGFSDDDIVYMNPYSMDTDNDGYPNNEHLDYSLFSPESELEQAFTKVAQSITENQQFVLYIHGHGDSDSLKINKEYWLPASELQRLINKISSNVQKIIVIDTCYSGSLLDDLADNENQIVMTSADDHTLAWNVEYSNFSDKLIYLLNSGKTLLEAFRGSEEMIIDNAKLFGDQRPQLDDNGDGQYSSADGVLMAKVYIGKEGVSQSEPPFITGVHPTIELPEGQASTTLWVKTSPSNEKIQTVRGVVIHPNFELSNYEGENTLFDREEIELQYNGAQDRYEINYTSFRESGIWKIMYQAQGAEGDWSDIAFGEVNAAGVNSSVIVDVGVNQSSYKVGDQLRLDVTLNGNEIVDMYVAIIFPGGFLQTITYPLIFNIVNSLVPYKSGVELTGEQAFSILDFQTPVGMPKGVYYCYAVVMIPDSDPWDIENWIHYDFKSFEFE